MGGVSGSNLEMRCSADEAWYDGTLRFSTDSKELVLVHFNDFDEEEDETFPTSSLLDPKKLKLRVRVRSQQLQDFQCKLVNEGQNICGCLDDGDDRRYYDAKVVSIVEHRHSFKDDGEECNCDFKLLWLDGPKKGKQTQVGCAEVCFLSNDAPEEDPMVKNLVKRLAGNGEQRRKLAPKTLPSPRPRTPSPSLELAPSKKQSSSKGPSPSSLELAPSKKKSSSKEHPPSTLPNQRVQLRQQASAKSVGSKNKRIMQVEVTEQPDLASDNDRLNNLEMDARPTSTPKDRSRDGSEDGDARRHGDESNDSEQRGAGGEGKKGFVPVEKRRLVKVKAPKMVAPAPEVVREEEAAVKEDDNRMSFRELVKLNTKKMATDIGAVRDEAAAVSEGDDIPRPAKERVKSNTKKMATPDVAATRDEAAASEEDNIPRPAKEWVKSNTKKMATPDVAAARDEAAVREDDHVRRPFKVRVKFTTTKTATRDVAAVREETAAVREDDIPRSSFKEQVKLNTKKMATPDLAAARDEAISQTLGERVKLKSAEKSKPASQVEPQKVSPQKKKPASKLESHKVSPQKVGEQVVGKQMQKNRKQMQLEDHPSRLSSKHGEATRPGTPSRSNDVAGDVATTPKEQQKRRPGRPRKHPLPEPVKTVTESLASKKQPVLGFSKEQRQNSQQEEIIDAVNAEKQSSDPANKKTAKKKRPREEERPLPDTDDIGSDKSTQEEEETLDEAHVTEQAVSGRGNNKEKKTKRPWESERQPQNDDAVSDKSADDEDHTPVTNNEKKKKRRWDLDREPENDDVICDKSARAHTMAADDHEDHTPVARQVDATNERLGHVAKKSMADGYRDIQNKFGSNRLELLECSVEKTSSPDAHEAITPGSSEEFTCSPPPLGDQIQETVRVSELRGHNNETTTPGASGKRRRRQMLLPDDEEDVDVAKKTKNGNDLHGSVDSSANGQDECNDPKTTSTSALDEETVLQKQDAVKATRLLLIKNMEMDVSAYDAMQLLRDQTEGVCAVHVLPVVEFQNSTIAYALYRDNGSALKAFQHLASCDRFVVSLEGRPWIISLATDVYGPHLYGFAAYTAFKSDDPGIWGIISDQPPVQELLVVTKQRDSKGYSQALQRSKTYEEHQKWHKELHDRIVKDEMKG